MGSARRGCARGHARSVWLALVAALGLAVGLAACAGGASGAPPVNTIQLGAASLSPTSLTISAGTTVHFVDAADGAIHQLCLGRDGTCHSSASGPAALVAPGLRIQPGQTRDVVFGTPGTYAITCAIHPQMNLTVTVQ